MQRVTKITASIGPACSDYGVLRRMIAAGVDMCRLNFSHDTGAVQGTKIDMIRSIARNMDKYVGIIIDLQGPKHRIGNFATEDKYKIHPGQKFTFDDNPAPGDSTRVNMPDTDILRTLRVGERVLLNDGKIEMRVDATDGHNVVCTVVRGTEIWSRRGLNFPDSEIKTPVLTAKDMADLEYAITKSPEYVAISFVGSASDIGDVRDFITARTAEPIKIIAKIERAAALNNLSEIVAAADAIMIARGDLAIEVPFEQVPAISRRIIRECRKQNRPVIIATQMLASMVENEFPTRAEISDVATAAYLRTDSTMTSDETTIGANPVVAIETMARILNYTDMDTIKNPYDWSDLDDGAHNDWSRSVASMATLNNAAAIIVFSRDGDAVFDISCRRPDIPIIAVCDNRMTAAQLSLCRGVCVIYDANLFATRDAFAVAHVYAINRGHLVIVDDDKISLRTIE